MATKEQIDKLKAIVDQLVTDQDAATAATAAANDAQTVATKAQADVTSTQSAEAVADGKVAADVQTLVAFAESLAATPPPPPPPG
jgi:hypothetical protein